MKKRWNCLIVLLMVIMILSSCSTHKAGVTPRVRGKSVAMMGHTIQAGAFASVENAVRLTDRLKRQGLDATYFKASDGLFKVRFGNYASKEQAKLRAQMLQKDGVIEEFYIVMPEDYSATKRNQYGESYLREQIVKTAQDFIGVPYLWGGINARTGFDCSGLAMTVYQLNGLDLPRHSAAQYDAGDDVDRENLRKGDLVFFSTGRYGKVSHVGIYIGDDQFIHATSRGKKIRVDSLSTEYYEKHYVGAKNYL